MSNVIRLEDKLAALDVRDEAAAPTDEDAGDVTAALFWGRPGDPDNELLTANNRREISLWGDLLLAKRALQAGGFGVWFVDAKGRFAGKPTEWINVGDKAVGVDEFKAMAARIRKATRLAAKRKAV